MIAFQEITMRHILISKLALIMLCAMPMSACGDAGTGKQSATAKQPTLDPKVLGRWSSKDNAFTSDMGDLIITPNRVTFEYMGSAQMIVNQDYVSLKWDNDKQDSFCGDEMPPVAIIEPISDGVSNQDLGVQITFYPKGKLPEADRGNDIGSCKTSDWKKWEKPLPQPDSPVLDSKIFGRWVETESLDEQNFGDVTITADRITFQKIGSANMIVHQDYVSLKWDDNKTDPSWGDAVKPPAVSIRSITRGIYNNELGVQMAFYSKDPLSLKERPLHYNASMIINWAKPLLKPKSMNTTKR
jgi:hypothetical protein